MERGDFKREMYRHRCRKRKVAGLRLSTNSLTNPKILKFYFRGSRNNWEPKSLHAILAKSHALEGLFQGRTSRQIGISSVLSLMESHGLNQYHIYVAEMRAQIRLVSPILLLTMNRFGTTMFLFRKAQKMLDRA